MKLKLEHLGIPLALIVIGLLYLKHYERYHSYDYGMRCGYVSNDNFQCGWMK